MRDKEAHNRFDYLKDRLNELEAEIADVRKIAVKEPSMYTDDISNTWIIIPKPTRVPLYRAIRLILKHLNMEVHGISEGFELKEIVDDDPKD